MYGNRTNSGDPAGKSFGFGGIRFLHENCGQPFYLLRFGFAFLVDLLQPLFVMLRLQSVAQFHGGETFLGGEESSMFCGRLL